MFRMFAWDGPKTIQLSPTDFERKVIRRWLYTLADHGCLGRRILETIYMPPEFPKPVPGFDWQWVYFARRPDDGVAKVGISRDPVIRVGQLRWPHAGSGGFELVAVMPFCGLKHEAALKTWLRFSTFKGSTEYLRDTPEVRLFLWSLRSAHAPNQALHEKQRFGWGIEAIGGFFRECAIRSGVLPHDGRYRCAVCRSPRHNRTSCPVRRQAEAA